MSHTDLLQLLPLNQRYIGQKVHQFLTKEMWQKGSNFYPIDSYALDIYTGECKVCLNGALMLAYGCGTPSYHIKVTIIEKDLINNNLVEWNDDKDRTFEEVMTLCRSLDV